MAQAFVGKKPHLIQDADNLFQQLQQTKTAVMNSASVYVPRENREIDFALERGLCSLLVGELDECRSWLGLDSDSSPYRDPSIVEFVLENSRDDEDSDLPGLCKLLETWLMEVVFPRFRDTKDIQFKLGDYYDDATVLRYLERLEGVGGSPLAAAAAIVRIGAEASAVLGNVKASAIEALQKVFPPKGYSEESKTKPFQEDARSEEYLFPEMESLDLMEGSDEEDLVEAVKIPMNDISSAERSEDMIIADKIKDASMKIMTAGLAIGLITLIGLKYLPAKRGSSVLRKEVGAAMASDTVTVGMILTNATKWEKWKKN